MVGDDDIRDHSRCDTGHAYAARAVRTLRCLAVLGVATLALSGCVRFGWDRLSTKVPDAVLDTIQEESLRTEHDALIEVANAATAAGESPNEKLRRITQHLATRMAQIGLEAAGQDGFLQPFPLNAIRVDEVQAQLGGRALQQGYDLALWTLDDEGSAEARGSIVFVGHGIVAPERDRDDYLGLALRDQVALVLAGPPDSSYVDTWYADPRYQCAEAVRHGAAGVLLVHEGGAPFERGDSGRSPGDSDAPPSLDPRRDWNETVEHYTRFHFAPRADSLEHAVFQAWIPEASGNTILEEVGIDPARAREAARTQGFRGRALELEFAVELTSSVTPTTGYNLVGMIPGEYADEQSLLIACSMDGSPNSLASAAALIEIAQAFTELAEPTARSVVFAVFGAGAWGGPQQWGAESYAAAPARDLGSTAGVLVIDAGLADAEAGSTYHPTGRADAKIHEETSAVQAADTLMAGGILDNELGMLLTAAALEDGYELRNESDGQRWFATAAPAFARQGLPAATVGCEVADLRAAMRVGFHMGQTRGSPRWDQLAAFRFFPRR